MSLGVGSEILREMTEETYQIATTCTLVLAHPSSLSTCLPSPHLTSTSTSPPVKMYDSHITFGG